MSSRVESRSTLLITNDLGPHAGGIESFILGLIGEMDGNQIVIYTSREEGDAEFDQILESRHGVKIIRDKTTILLPTPAVNRRVIAVMKRYQSRYIWFGAAAPLALMSAQLKKNGAHRIVALTHGHEVWWAKVPPFSFALRRMAGSVDTFTYLGDFTKNAMRPALGERAHLVRLAPGIDVEHFSPGERNPELIQRFGLSGKKVIVCVGRLVRRKGQDRLIDSMPKILMREPNAHLLIVGRGTFVSKLREKARVLGVEKNITFVGRIDFHDLPTYLRLGDIFAMPSRSRYAGLEVEGLGIVYLEASACAIPVIAGASGGAPDAVLQGKTGIVVDGTSTEKIAEGICTLLGDADLRKSMALTGRDWTVKEWSWKLWGSRFKEILYSTQL